jgi:hypothetical protein
MTHVRCPACGARAETSQRFCGSCGAALPAADVETMTNPIPTPSVGHAENARADRGSIVVLIEDAI